MNQHSADVIKVIYFSCHLFMGFVPKFTTIISTEGSEIGIRIFWWRHRIEIGIYFQEQRLNKCVVIKKSMNGFDNWKEICKKSNWAEDFNFFVLSPAAEIPYLVLL